MRRLRKRVECVAFLYGTLHLSALRSKGEKEKMKAIRIRPRELPQLIDVENTLEALQEQVGGYIQAVPAFSDAVVICDEEGRLKGYPANCTICGVGYVGTVLIVGVDGEEFCDIPKEAAVPFVELDKCL